MLKLFKNTFLSILTIISFSACTGGSTGSTSQPVITAIPITNISQYFSQAGYTSGFFPIFFGYNAYTTFVLNIPFVSYPIILPNGLNPQQPGLSPNFWMLNTSITSSFTSPTVLTFPIGGAVDNLGRITFSALAVSGQSQLVAYLTVLGAKSPTNGTIAASISQASLPFSESFSFGTINGISLAYPINNNSGSFAIVNAESALVFANFVPQGSTSTITGLISNACRVVPGATESISVINTINDTGNNKYLVGVGTESGAICIYDFVNQSWTNLTVSAISRGYTVGKIFSLQFLNFNNNRYLYFSTSSVNNSSQPSNLWRATLDNNNQVSSLVNLLNSNIYQNPPTIISPFTFGLFIDPFNNVYVGVYSTFSNTPTSLNGNKIAVLPNGSNLWQTVPLNNSSESSVISAISLAVDGKTPVVELLTGDFDVPSISSSSYYLTGVNK